MRIFSGLLVTLLIIAVANAFHSPFGNNAFAMRSKLANTIALKATITEGVEFDTIAREWRLKWSGDNDKKSLADVQKKLVDLKATISQIPGLKGVQRVVCGGCLDYKVVVSLDADKFADWEAKQFAPESDFLSAVKAIPGVSTVETQTYTIMPVI